MSRRLTDEEREQREVAAALGTLERIADELAKVDKRRDDLLAKRAAVYGVLRGRTTVQAIAQAAKVSHAAVHKAWNKAS